MSKGTQFIYIPKPLRDSDLQLPAKKVLTTPRRFPYFSLVSFEQIPALVVLPLQVMNLFEFSTRLDKRFFKLFKRATRKRAGACSSDESTYWQGVQDGLHKAFEANQAFRDERLALLPACDCSRLQRMLAIQADKPDRTKPDALQLLARELHEDRAFAELNNWRDQASLYRHVLRKIDELRRKLGLDARS